MKPLGAAAWPLALLYGAGVTLFRKGYEVGLRGRQTFPLPVISVGNIEAGGTGKSPLVVALCQQFFRSGIRVGVVSRGYGRTRSRENRLICRGEGLLVPVEQAGDEPALLAAKVPGVRISVAADRREGIRLLEGLCDLVILDDGFQSLEILPTLSLVFLPEILFQRRPGIGDLLPAGPLRELPEVLSRATHWILRRTESFSGVPTGREETLQKNLRAMLGEEGMRPILPVDFRLFRIRDFAGRQAHPVDSLSGRTVAVVAGIANPQRIVRDLEAFGSRVAGLLALPDHAPETPEVRGTIAEFAREMHSRGAEILLTTEKDRIKWTQCPEGPLPVFVLEGETRFLDTNAWDRILSLPFHGSAP
ncbi:MAG: tetraacyldisaccharide 4'-kinase [Leptospirillia bacterium]